MTDWLTIGRLTRAQQYGRTDGDGGTDGRVSQTAATAATAPAATASPWLLSVACVGCDRSVGIRSGAGRSTQRVQRTRGSHPSLQAAARRLYIPGTAWKAEEDFCCHLLPDIRRLMDLQEATNDEVWIHPSRGSLTVALNSGPDTLCIRALQCRPTCM